MKDFISAMKGLLTQGLTSDRDNFFNLDAKAVIEKLRSSYGQDHSRDRYKSFYSTELGCITTSKLLVYFSTYLGLAETAKGFW